MSWKRRFAEEKAGVGMAPAGTVEYFRNAARALSHCPDRADTRAKMAALSASPDAVTADIAYRWLLSRRRTR